MESDSEAVKSMDLMKDFLIPTYLSTEQFYESEEEKIYGYNPEIGHVTFQGSDGNRLKIYYEMDPVMATLDLTEKSGFFDVPTERFTELANECFENAASSTNKRLRESVVREFLSLLSKRHCILDNDDDIPSFIDMGKSFKLQHFEDFFASNNIFPKSAADKTMVCRYYPSSRPYRDLRKIRCGVHIVYEYSTFGNMCPSEYYILEKAEPPLSNVLDDSIWGGVFNENNGVQDQVFSVMVYRPEHMRGSLDAFIHYMNVVTTSSYITYRGKYLDSFDSYSDRSVFNVRGQEVNMNLQGHPRRRGHWVRMQMCGGDYDAIKKAWKMMGTKRRHVRWGMACGHPQFFFDTFPTERRIPFVMVQGPHEWVAQFLKNASSLMIQCRCATEIKNRQGSLWKIRQALKPIGYDPTNEIFYVTQPSVDTMNNFLSYYHESEPHKDARMHREFHIIEMPMNQDRDFAYS